MKLEEEICRHYVAMTRVIDISLGVVNGKTEFNKFPGVFGLLPSRVMALTPGQHVNLQEWR